MEANCCNYHFGDCFEFGFSQMTFVESPPGFDHEFNELAEQFSALCHGRCSSGVHLDEEHFRETGESG